MGSHTSPKFHECTKLFWKRLSEVIDGLLDHLLRGAVQSAGGFVLRGVGHILLKCQWIPQVAKLVIYGDFMSCL